MYSSEFLLLLACSTNDSGKMKEVLIETASEDLYLLTRISAIETEEKEFIMSVWAKTHRIDLCEYIRSCLSRDLVGLVFTQSKTALSASLFPDFPVEVANFSAFKREIDLVQSLRSFDSSALRCYLLEICMSSHAVHLNWLRFVIEKTMRKFKTEKTVVIVARVQRNLPVAGEVWWLAEWPMRFLSMGERATEELAEMSTPALLQRDTASLLRERLPVLTMEAYEKIQFCGENAIARLKSVQEVCSLLPSSPKLVSALIEKVTDLVLRPPLEGAIDWREEVLCNPAAISSGRDLETAILTVEMQQIVQAYARVIYEIESEGALASFFTDVFDRDLLEAIWLEGFSSLQCERHLQTTSHSNFLPSKRTVQFPFIRRDCSLLRSLWKEYKAAVDSYPAKALYTFETEFRRKSVVSRFLPAINSSSQLQHLYLSDLLDLLLEEKTIEQQRKPLLEAVLDLKFAGQRTLEEKVMQFWANRRLVKLINRLISLWNEAGKEQFAGQLLDKLRDYMKTVLIPTESVDFSMRTTSSPEVSSYLSQELDTFCLQLQPAAAVLASFPSLQHYSLFVERLTVCLKIASHYTELKFAHMEVLDFWTKFLPLACHFSLPTATVVSLFEGSQRAPADKYSLPYSPHFISTLVTLVDANLRRNTSDLDRFKATFYGILIEKDMNFIGKIAEIVSNESEFRPFSALIVKLMEKIGLTDVSGAITGLLEREFDCAACVESALSRFPQFAVRISDAVTVKCAQRTLNQLEYVTDRKKEFTQAWESISASDTEFRRVVLCAALRTYLDCYCFLLLSPEVQVSDWEPIAKSVGKRLSEDSPLAETMRGYCLKEIKRKHPEMGYRTLKETLKSTSQVVNWVQKLDFSSVEPKEVPLYSLISDDYSIVYRRLRFFVENKQKISDLSVYFSSTSRGKLTFLVSFWSLSQEKPLKSLQIWLDLHQRELQCYYNKPIYFLLRLAATSRLEDVFVGRDKKGRARVLYMYLSVLLSSAEFMSPLSSGLFTSAGEIWPDVEIRFSQIYKIGAESRLVYMAVLELLRYLKSRDLQGETRPVCCCPSCEYMCLVTEPYPASCPFCKARLMHDREHMLDYKEAIDRAAKQVKSWSENEKKAYLVHQPMNPSHLPVRTFSHVASFRFLHWGLNAALYFVYATELVSQERLERMVSFTIGNSDFSSYFSSVLSDDLAVIASNLPHDYLYWVEAAIERISYMTENEGLRADTIEQRFEFERAFEQDVAEIDAEKPQRRIATYMETCEFRDFAWVREMERMEVEPADRLKALLRVRKMGDFGEFREKFRGREEEFPLIQLYLQAEEEFAKLKCLIPIRDFVSALSHKYSHRLTRKESSEKVISSLFTSDPQLSSLFLSLRKTWNKHLSSTEFTYAEAVLPPKSISESDPISAFVPDRNDSPGMYLLAAGKYLCELQNRLIKSAKNLESPTSSPLASLSKSAVLHTNLRNSQFFSDFWACHPSYGRGVEVVYDWEQVESMLARKFKGANRIASDQLAHFQYKFEGMSGQLSAVEQIAGNIPQKQLEGETLRQVEDFLRNLEVEMRESKEMAYSSLFEAMSKVVSYAAYVKTEANSPISSLSDIIPDYKSLAEKRETLMNVSLCHVVSLYEVVESRYFEYAKKLLSQNSQKSSSDLVVKLRKLCEKLKLKLELLTSALERMIMRCLMGRIPEKMTVGMLITRPDLWGSASVTEQQRAELRSSLERVPLEDTLALYESLKQDHQAKSLMNLHKLKDTQKQHLPPFGKGRLNSQKLSKKTIGDW